MRGAECEGGVDEYYIKFINMKWLFETKKRKVLARALRKNIGDFRKL